MVFSDSIGEPSGMEVVVVEGAHRKDCSYVVVLRLLVPWYQKA
jgi:hypothetical protein